MISNRAALAWAVLGVAAFTVYGSLVPFDFRPLRLSVAVNVFRKVLAGGVSVYSRSDAVANVMLGMPLGFTLLGLLTVDRGWPRGKVVVVGLLLLPACALFAATVEFAQLFTLTRHCAVSDMVAQPLGAACGMAVWVLCGQRFIAHARAVWIGADLNAAGRLLVAYVVLLAFIQALPLDLTASPADLYRKLRDDVTYIPFGEFTGKTDAARWEQTAKLLKLVGLYLPVGLLATQLKGRFERWKVGRVALAAVALAACLEAVQLVVKSRSPGVTDVCVGAFAVVAGWYLARVHHEGLAIPFVISWGVVWLAGMTPITQAAPGTLVLESPRPFDWIPGLPLEGGHPLFALEEMLTKLVLFGLVGVLIAAWRLPPRVRRGPPGSVRVAVLIAAALGLFQSALFESSQRWTAAHTPCVTDVLLGGMGAALGVLVASRARV